MSERGFEKVAGKFHLTVWLEGYPASMELVHQEPNGERRDFRLFGVEELHDLKFVVDRALEIIGKTT